MKDFNTIIGNNLKHIRSQKQFSLDKVSEMTGVSKGMLAQIERGVSNPTIAILWKIATGLNVSFSYFMEEMDEELPPVISKSGISPFLEEDGKMKVYPLFPYDNIRKFEMFTIVLESDCIHRSEAHAQGVEEYIIMNKGSMLLIVGDKKIILKAGDAIRYKADVPHQYINEKQEKAEFQHIIFYAAKSAI